MNNFDNPKVIDLIKYGSKCISKDTIKIIESFYGAEFNEIISYLKKTSKIEKDQRNNFISRFY